MPETLRIREARAAAGLTQKKAAKRAGLSQPYWSALETGVYETCTVATLRKVAKALGCDIIDLIDES